MYTNECNLLHDVTTYFKILNVKYNLRYVVTTMFTLTINKVLYCISQ